MQSLTFDRARWSPSEARRWVRAHGGVAPKVRATANQYRIRQFDPARCQYRTVPFGDSGVSGVVELPRRRAPAHVVAEVDRQMLSR